MHPKLVEKEGQDELKANKQGGREWYLYRHKHPVVSSEGRKQDLDHRSAEEQIRPAERMPTMKYDKIYLL